MAAAYLTLMDATLDPQERLEEKALSFLNTQTGGEKIMELHPSSPINCILQTYMVSSSLDPSTTKMLLKYLLPYYN